MIKVTFEYSGEVICGFRVSGHSGFSGEGSDIVCAAVSSAVIMAANTITEIQHINAEVTDSDGLIILSLSKTDASSAQDILLGLKLHLTALSGQYKKYIKLNFSEV